MRPNDAVGGSPGPYRPPDVPQFNWTPPPAPPKPKAKAKSKPRPYNPPQQYFAPAPPPPSIRSNSTGQISMPVPQQVVAPPRPVAPPKPVTPPLPVVPSIDKWLGADPTYLQQLAGFNATHANYVTEQGRQTNSYNTDYTTKLRELAVQRGIGQDNLNNDYASRGLIHSGLYGTASGVYNKDQNNQTAQLNTGKANFLSELSAALGQFISQQGVDTQQARQDAINRRASKYGV